MWTFIPIPQATLGRPESGMCCGRTWQALLGADSEPRHIHLVLKPAAASSDGDGDGADSDGAAGPGGFGDDMTESEGRGVWLLGEQRWEKRN